MRSYKNNSLVSPTKFEHIYVVMINVTMCFNIIKLKKLINWISKKKKINEVVHYILVISFYFFIILLRLVLANFMVENALFIVVVWNRKCKHKFSQSINNE